MQRKLLLFLLVLLASAGGVSAATWPDTFKEYNFQTMAWDYSYGSQTVTINRQQCNYCAGSFEGLALQSANWALNPNGNGNGLTQGNGNRNIALVNTKANDKVTIVTTGTISSLVNGTNTNGTMSNGTCEFEVTADGVFGFTHDRNTYIRSITITRNKQSYTLNYTYNGQTIKTESSNAFVGDNIAQSPVVGTDGNTYYTTNEAIVQEGVENYTVEMTSMDQGVYAFVKAVDANGNQLALFKSEQSGTMGQQGYVYVRRVVKYNNKYYDCGEGDYQVNVNYGETSTKTYTVNDNISFFQEAEDFTGKSISNPWAARGDYWHLASGGFWYRLSGDNGRGNVHVWTDAIQEGAYYDISVHARNQRNQGDGETIQIRIRLADGTIQEPQNATLSWAPSTRGVYTLNDIYIPTGASIDILNPNNYNMNLVIDYVLAKKTNTAAPTLSFSPQTATANIQDLNFTEPTLTVQNSNGGNIVYKSSDLNVARVNPLTGDVFMLDGTTSDEPVIITAYLYYTANGVQYTVSANYKLTINVGNDAEFRTVENEATAWVAGKYGTRKVESVPNITMYTGNPDETSNVTIIQIPNNDYGKLATTTLAGDGWHDVQFGIDGQTPTEGSFYTFEPKVDGHLKVSGYSTSGSKPAWIVDSQNLTTGLDIQWGQGEKEFSLDLTGGHKYYLYGANPYYCYDGNKITTQRETVGSSDYSTGFDWGDQNCSDIYTIGSGQTLTIFFKMHTDPNKNSGGINTSDPDWNNWLLRIHDGNNALFLRPDNDPSSGAGDLMDGRYSIPVDNYDGMYPYVNGADVKLTISRNREHVTITVMIKGNDGKIYIKQQLYNSSSADGEINARIHPLHSYLTGFKAYRDDAWNVFKLHSFEFISNYRYEDPSIVYINGNIYAADDLSTPLTENISVSTNGNTVTFKQTLLGATGGTPTFVIDNYGDTEAVSTSDGEFSFDKTKGGSYVVNATLNGVTARYILTVPYETHKWKFGPEGTEPTMAEITGKKTQYGVEWRVNARLKQKDTTTGYMYSFDHTLITGKNVINGDNVLYIKNSDGLIINTTSGNAIGYAVDNKDGGSAANYLEVKKAQKLQAKKTALQATVAFQNLTPEEQADTLSKVTVTPQDVNRIIYETFAYSDETTVENPTDFWFGYGGTSFTIPYAKAGQYVKLHWRRYVPGNGSEFTLTNLKDLDGKDVTGTISISGYQTHGNYGWNNPIGNYIFQVKADGPVTISKADNGWVSISDVELTNEYSTDFKLIELTEDAKDYQDDIAADLTDQPISMSSNGMTDAKMYFSAYPGQNFSADAWEAEFSIDLGTSGVNAQIEKTEWFKSQRGVQYYRYTLSAGHDSGHGNVKLTARLKTNGYVFDKLDGWVAVGTVTPQSYPRTWDFTAQNMDYAEAGKAAMVATANNAQNYGAWNTETTDGTTIYSLTGNTRDTDMYLHTYNAAGGYKPLFANGSELTAGSNTFAETVGMGVTMAEATAVNEVKLDGEGLDGVKALSIPMLSAGDYVYVIADAAPSATVTAYDKATADGKTTYTEADGETIATVSTQAAKYLGNGVYGFKVTAGEYVNMNLTFNEAAKVYKVGVSDIVKTFDQYGFSTESRNKNIDYSFISAPAYAIVQDEFAYNYDQVVVSPEEDYVFGIAPAGTGVMLYNSNLKSDASPLFYAGNNILDGTDNLSADDNGLAEENMLVGIVDGGDIAQHQKNKDNVDCDAFVLTYIYSVYNSTIGDDKETNKELLDTDAFFRVKESINAPANKAYLLVPSELLPKALWDRGTGSGTPGLVKNMVRINFGELDEGELDEPTGINTMAAVENLDNGEWYNLSGQKLSGRPATAGVYIVNGKKVMIK